MQASGTGGYDGHDITKRVGKLEVSVDELHADSARTQAALAGLQASQDSMSRALTDIANKLDQHRTKRPELGAVSGVAAVILTIGAMAFWPINQRLDGIDEHIKTISSMEFEHAEMIGGFRAEKSYILDQLKQLHDDQMRMKENRFTKADGQRLENKIDSLHAGK